MVAGQHYVWKDGNCVSERYSPLPSRDEDRVQRRAAGSARVELLARRRGALLGAAVGDALGWPQEQNNNIVGGHKSRNVEPSASFQGWARYGGGQYNRYLDPVQPGEYSDDTQLIMCVARSVLRGDDWLSALTTSELPALTAYSRGAGRALLAAGRSWAQGTPPWLASTSRQQRSDPRRSYFEAGGNGVAMRIVPHVLATFDQPAPVLFQRVASDAVSTHGHPRALVGAALHAAALRTLLGLSGTLGYGELLTALIEDRGWAQPHWMEVVDDSWVRAYRASTGRAPEGDWEATVEEVDRLSRVAHDAIVLGSLAQDHATLDELGCFDRRRNGAGTINAVAAAFLASRAAAQPQAGLLGAAFLKSADTDTLASMTASLLGALHGPQWLQPLDSQVQDWKYLVGLADALTQPGSGQLQLTLASAATELRQVRARDLEKWEADLRSTQGELRLGRGGDGPPVSREYRQPALLTQFVDGREVSLYGPQMLESRSASTVARWYAVFADGQSGYLDLLTKTSTRPSQSSRHVGAPVPASPGSGAIDSVELATPDLGRLIAFYRDVLGVDLERISTKAARLGPAVQIWEVKNPALGAHRAAMLTVVVADLVETVARARALTAPVLTVDIERGEARLLDPDGRELRVLLRKVDTR